MRIVCYRRYLFLALTLAWMFVIFIFSAQPGNDSASLSSSITYFFISIVYPNFEKMDINTQLDILTTLQFFIRKGAHMSEYAVLWCLSYQYLKTYALSRKQCFRLALFLSFAYACTDEFHQSLIPGRCPSFVDVMIDTSGALFFGLFYRMLEKNIIKKVYL